MVTSTSNFYKNSYKNKRMLPTIILIMSIIFSSFTIAGSHVNKLPLNTTVYRYNDLINTDDYKSVAQILTDDSYTYYSEMTSKQYYFIYLDNQTPEISCPGSQETHEGELLEFTVNATDPDGTIPFLSAENLPFGSNFMDLGNGTGSFSWVPLYNQSGMYDVIFNASDGELWDICIVNITVDNVNQAPEITCPDPQFVEVEKLLVFWVNASDFDGTIPFLSAEDLPYDSNFTDFGNGTGMFNWTPEKGHLGVYYVEFIASDGILEDFCIVEITVHEEINLPPEAQDDYIEVDEDSFDNIVDVLANDSDPNDDPLVIESVTDPIHGVVFNHGHRITYTPDSEYCGDDEFSYTINDGQGEKDTAMVYVTVICINEAPITPGRPSGPTNGKVGSQIPYTAVTTDPDDDLISYFFDWGDDTTSGWTEFFPSGTNVSKSHKWGEGTFNIRVKAKDEKGLQSDWSEHLTITIPRSRQSHSREFKSTSAYQKFLSVKSVLTAQLKSLNLVRSKFNFNSILFLNCYSKAITIWILFQLVLRSYCRELN